MCVDDGHVVARDALAGEFIDALLRRARWLSPIASMLSRHQLHWRAGPVSSALDTGPAMWSAGVRAVQIFIVRC